MALPLIPQAAEPSPEEMHRRRLSHLRHQNDSADLELVCAYLGMCLESLGATLAEMQQHPFSEYAGADDSAAYRMSWMEGMLDAIVENRNPDEDMNVMDLRQQALEYFLPRGMSLSAIRAKASTTLISAFGASRKRA